MESPFRTAGLIVVLCCLAIPLPAAAQLADTSWDLESRERLSLSRLGSTHTDYSGVMLTFDVANGWTLTHPAAGTYTGTTILKKHGRFVLVPDDPSVGAFEGYMAGIILDRTEGTSVQINRFTDRLKGRLKGETIRLKLKVVATGRVTFDSHSAKGKAVLRAKMSGGPEGGP
jgi:hypothetical protein